MVRKPHQFSDVKTRKVKQAARLPTRAVTTQNNHIFMSIYAAFKLECLKIKHKAIHFVLRTKLFIKANQLAYEVLQKLQALQHQLLIYKS